ncbi:DUF1479-domain-containing protein [Gymnopus androsaceus JB14]|uniref:DUF1479-domain-containing protein n=1 Tax=Gymnopus androsaceus JB14 TaxID=1447944 RepID=A0A6A4IIG9_9AGAR|nr:DUF1479-domain-containing protein [Gymnopus androsaceus JB14]
MSSANENTELLLKLKQEIAASYPDFQTNVTRAWKEVIEELGQITESISAKGSAYIPQINFSELRTLPPERVDEIRRIGSVVIKDVVDDAEATAWKESLQEFIKANPDVPGKFLQKCLPANDKQFFMLYWTKPQVEARSHPNVLAASAWLNNLYHDSSEKNMEGVDLSTPLTYADRFRIRHPGPEWTSFPPHVDGGSIERWQDPAFRSCFNDILSGDWRKHDPYALSGRFEARSSLYQRANQASVFRTFQGWLAMSETAPTQGTLKVFPDVLASNAYLILRPFFRPLVPFGSAEILDPKNWEYDISFADFPGIYASPDGGFTGPRPTIELHPHMMLDKTMISVPKVMPGDMVFWHCDVVHAVEVEHTGQGDSAVMYIGAVPTTPINKMYVQIQKDCFLKSINPPDYPKGSQAFSGIARRAEDLLSPMGVHAMGLSVAV